MIRFADESDVHDIMRFIDTHWKHGHIMGSNKIMFEFQHKYNHEISFVISRSDQTGEINGILGYIPYEYNSDSKRDVTLAIWKALKSNDDNMLGVNILLYLMNNGRINTLSVNGINTKVIAVYNFLGMNTGLMKHYYRLGKNNAFTAALVNNKFIPECKYSLSESESEIFCLDDFDSAVKNFGLEECLTHNEKQLVKSPEFLKRRYYMHPFFSYIKYGIKHNDSKLFLVFRIQECRDSKVLRLIDCIGEHDLLKYFTPFLDKLLQDNNCEYVDCYETGINGEIFSQGGWLDVQDSGNIIPEYFSPFEQRNIDIYYMSQIKDVIMFKGDGDMDRPN